MNSRQQTLCLLALMVAGMGTALAGPVDINTADAPTLAAQLNGVGPVLAREIVLDRERNGRFDSAADLLRVAGIGERIIERNRSNILIREAGTPQP